MKRAQIPQFTVVKLVWAWCLFCGAPARADLASDVRKALSDKALSKAQVSVEIVRLDSDSTRSASVFSYKGAESRIPASNLKLVTTAAALELLGKDFRFRTTLLVRPDGQGRFDVALVGDGDPTLGDAEILRAVGWGVETVFVNWAQALRKRGIEHIGSVFVDDSIFDEQFAHPNWPAEQEHKRYVAQVGGVNLNANCVDFFIKTTGAGNTVRYTTDPMTRYIDVGNTCTTGARNAVWLSRQRRTNSIVLRGEIDISNDYPISVTVHDPSMFAATVLRETLVRQGIDVRGEVQRDTSIRAAMQAAATQPSRDPARWYPVAIHETPLSAVLARANKDSMNLYAEALCKRIGAAASGENGSWENGNAAIAAFLQSIGVRDEQFVLDDGSGLSKQNRISASAIARVLAHTFAGPNREAFLASLSVAGGDGTLEKRFRDSKLRGRAFGKSGYVTGVSSLSGYVHAQDGQWYAFAIIMNNVTDIASCKAIQERIVTAIDNNSSAKPLSADGNAGN